MTYVLYARGHRAPDKYPRDHIVKFDDASHAKVWLEHMEHKLPEGYTVRCDRMAEILAAPPPPADWRLTDERVHWILRFKYGTWDEVHVRDEPEVSEAKQSQRAPRSQREAKAQRPDGYVTITELCNASDVAASDARAILRSHFDKPPYGWAFEPKRIPEIKKLIGIK